MAGAVWALDAWVFRPQRLREANQSPDVPHLHRARSTVIYYRHIFAILITYFWSRFLFSVSPETLLTAVLLTGGVVVLEAFSPAWLVRPKSGGDKSAESAVAEGLIEPVYTQYCRYLCLYILLILLVQAAVYDFALALVLSAVATALIWLVDVIFFRRRRLTALAELSKDTSDETEEKANLAAYEPLGVEYARSFFPIIMLVLLVRSFLFEPFRIPSDSMVPTLVNGDFIFVNKYVYGLRLPVLNKKVLETGQPKRGDVVVFRLPSDPTTNYIKRLVGLPGDRITYEDKELHINGNLVKVDFEPKIHADGFWQGIEYLGDSEHQFQVNTNRRGYAFEGEVPQGHYFFMGDNRDNSQDSRFPSVGYVPEKNLVGKAVLVWMSLSGSDGRIGQIE